MAKLFIIGNGFDSAHRIPSSFGDFRKFVKNERQDNSNTNLIISILDEADEMQAKITNSVVESTEDFELYVESFQAQLNKLIDKLESFSIKKKIATLLPKMKSLTSSSDIETVKAILQSVKITVSFCQDLDSAFEDLNRAYEPLYPFAQELMKNPDFDSPFYEKFEVLTSQFETLMNNITNYRSEYEEFSAEINPFLEIIQSYGFIPSDEFNLGKSDVIGQSQNKDGDSDKIE